MFSLRNKKNTFELSSIPPLIWSSAICCFDSLVHHTADGSHSFSGLYLAGISQEKVWRSEVTNLPQRLRHCPLHNN